MKNSKQHKKLNNLQVKAEKCLSRKEAKKIINRANKAQDKLNKQKKGQINIFKKILSRIFFETF